MSVIGGLALLLGKVAMLIATITSLKRVNWIKINAVGLEYQMAHQIASDVAALCTESRVAK